LGGASASEFYVLTFQNTVCSIFIGHVNKKNNCDEIARVFIQVRFTSKEAWTKWKEEGWGWGWGVSE
jgi:hypothetical protein